jgi:hypothetical protein
MALLHVLGALAPQLASGSRPSDAPRMAAAHVELPAAGVARADRHERHAGAPCHDAEPSPERSDLPILGSRCPCGCGGLPGNVTGHQAGSGPALLASAPILAARPGRTRLAAPAERLPAPPASRVEHVPISV